MKQIVNIYISHLDPYFNSQLMDEVFSLLYLPLYSGNTLSLVQYFA